MLFLGLDCGGTSSRALGVDGSGQPQYQGQSGAANWATTDRATLQRHLAEALEGCPTPDAVAVCMAGILTEEDADGVARLLHDRFGEVRIAVYPDYRALVPLVPEACAYLIAGTGTLLFTIQESQLLKSYANGALIGDEGSVMDLGRRALRAYDQGAESLGPILAEIYGTADLGAIIPSIYRSESPAGQLARLGPALGQSLDSGHSEATSVIRETLFSLARNVSRYLDRWKVGGSDAPLAVTGGLWSISDQILPMFIEALNEVSPDRLSVTVIKTAPVEGAVLLAKELMN